MVSSTLPLLTLPRESDVPHLSSAESSRSSPLRATFRGDIEVWMMVVGAQEKKGRRGLEIKVTEEGKEAGREGRGRLVSSSENRAAKFTPTRTLSMTTHSAGKEDQPVMLQSIKDREFVNQI